jgi:hypothetical protein
LSQRSLHISPDLSLPLAAVTSTIVVYGGKGMGKTNLGAVVAEECAKAGLRWSVIDPMGVWWGMRHSADGKGRGVECLILGGAHGDIPIEPTGGAVIADLIADNKVSAIIDISRKANGEMWAVAERIRFVNDYGKQLFRRQGSLIDGQRREPICQIVDEAARYIPQMIRAGNEDVAKCANTWSTIVEEGRNIGLGVVLLTQRSARLNKDVAELADLMLAFRTVGPNSIEAVIEWLGAHIPKDKAKAMIEQVRSLPVGSCLAVSPGWLEIEKVIRIRLRTTFDSSATPKPGQQAAKVRGDGAKPDLNLYVTRMKDTIERAAADDPKALRKRIAELDEQIDQLQTSVGTLRTTTGAYEKAMKAIDRMASDLAATALRIQEAIAAAQGRAAEIEASAPKPAPPQPIPEERPSERAMRLAKQQMTAPRRPDTAPSEGMTRAKQRILDALAMGQSMGRSKLSKLWVAMFAGASPKSSAFSNNLGSLRSAGLIEYVDGDVQLTADGETRVVRGPKVSIEEAHRFLLEQLEPARRRIMETLLNHRGDPMDRNELASQVSASPTSSAFSNNLGSLRSLKMLDYTSDRKVFACADLF